jgi:hypothetical protein
MPRVSWLVAKLSTHQRPPTSPTSRPPRPPFAPVLLPLAKKLGIDPVFFGVIMVVNLSMGLASPPSGATLFVSTAIAQERLDRVCRAVWPLFFSMVAILLLITFVPSLVNLIKLLGWGKAMTHFLSPWL